MAARKKTSKVEGTARKPRARAAETPETLIANVQQVWLAGMGAIARAQKEGPSAFQDAVAEGFNLLTRSRSTAEEMIRDAFQNAQGTVQTRFDSARDQANETWDNLEALFQNRVHKAMQQLGVPNAEEIRLLTRRVAELSEAVKELSGRQVKERRAARKAPPARAKRKTRSRAR
jgi:poly(hydroxyalkanoate) granule-associated protein